MTKQEPTVRVLRSLLPAGCALLALSSATLAAAQESSPRAESSAELEVFRPPLTFIENRGQWPEDIRFRLGRGHVSAAFFADGFGLNLVGMEGPPSARRAAAIRFRFEGETSVSEPPTHKQREAARGERRAEGLFHFFIGADPRQWRSDVPGWERIHYSAVWTGIDVVVHEGPELFEYDLLLGPDADLSAVSLRVEGADGIHVDAQGQLVIESAVGPMVHTAPVAWTVDGAGAQTPHPCVFRWIDDEHFGFEASPVPAGQRLVVDPGVIWSTLLGDLDEDLIRDVVRAPDGEVIATGGTYTYEFPTTVGAYDTTLNGSMDAFVSRLSADGSSLLSSTFLGGSSAEHGTCVALHPDGSVYVAGESLSTNLPTTAGAYRQTNAGLFDGFVAHLDRSGSLLLASSYIGSSNYEQVRDLALDPLGRPVLVGFTGDANFPTLGSSYDPTWGGGTSDGFLTRFKSDLSGLEISTFLGGAKTDSVECLLMREDGRMILGGYTNSSNIPMSSGALQSSLAGGTGDQDGFLMCLDANGQNLLWSTYLGGSEKDAVLDLAMTAAGEVLVVGETDSTDFPLSANAVQSLHGGMTDGFKTLLQVQGSATQLMNSTFLGGSDVDLAEGVVVLSTGQVVVAGATKSVDLPMQPWVFDSDFGKFPNSGLWDLFVTRYETDHSVSYSTYFGGGGDDFFSELLAGDAGSVVLAGYTNSYNFPLTPGAFDTGYDFSGLYDGFVSSFEFLRFPFTYGTGKQHSAGGVAQISTSGFPSYSGPGLDLWVDGALANSTGLFFHSGVAGLVPFAGGSLLMSPPFQRTAPQTVGWLGSGSLHVDVTVAMIGTTRYYQYWFADPADAFGVGLSDAVEVFFYP